MPDPHPPASAAPDPVLGAIWQRRAVLGLWLTTLCWGATFFLMKDAVDGMAGGLGHVHEATGRPEPGYFEPIYFLVTRFSLALALILLIFPRSIRGWTAGTWRLSALLAAPFAAGFVLQILGLRTTSPAISAFLTSLYVVFTAFLASLWQGRPLGMRMRIAVEIALAGLVLLLLGDGEWGRLGLGELLSAGCALAFAVHILVTDHATRREDPLRLTVGMLMISTLAMAAALPFLAGDWSLADPELHGAAWASDKFQRGILITATLGTVVALVIMNACQKAVSPTRAAVIYTLEPGWAAVFSYLFFAERFTLAKVVGGLLLLGANAVCAREQVQTGPAPAADPGTPAPPAPPA